MYEPSVTVQALKVDDILAQRMMEKIAEVKFRMNKSLLFLNKIVVSLPGLARLGRQTGKCGVKATCSPSERQGN